MVQFDNRKCPICGNVVRLDKPFYVEEKTRKPVHPRCAHAEANGGRGELLEGRENIIPLIAMGAAAAAPVVAEHGGKAVKALGKMFKKKKNPRKPLKPGWATIIPEHQMFAGASYVGKPMKVKLLGQLADDPNRWEAYVPVKKSNDYIPVDWIVSIKKASNPSKCPSCKVELRTRTIHGGRGTVKECPRCHERFDEQIAASNPSFLMRDVVYIPAMTRAEAAGVIKGVRTAGFKPIKVEQVGDRFRAYYYSKCREQKNYIHESLTPKEWYETFRTVRVDGHVITVGYSGYDPKTKKHAISELHSILHPKSEKAPCKVREKFGERWTTRREENISKGGAQRIAAHGRAQGKRARVMPIGEGDYDAFIDGHRVRNNTDDFDIPWDWQITGKTTRSGKGLLHEVLWEGGKKTWLTGPELKAFRAKMRENMAQSTSQMTAEAIRKRGYRARSIQVAKGDYQTFQGGKRKVRGKARIQKPIRARKRAAAPSIPTTPAQIVKAIEKAVEPIAEVIAPETTPKGEMSEQDLGAKILEALQAAIPAQ